MSPKPLTTFVLILLAAQAALGIAPEGSEARRALGERLAREGRCEAALPELEAVRSAHPRDALLSLRIGQCEMRLQRYGPAVRDFDRARGLDPDLAEAELGLAKAHYHLGEYDRADEVLAGEEDRLGDRAEFHLYRGMVALARGDAERALPDLERARAMDERVDPVAAFYLGLALAEVGQRDRAIAGLEGVVAGWPDTTWSAEAERRVAALRAAGARRAWLTLGAGFEYDTNVVLRGRDVTLPLAISDQADGRGVWLVTGGGDLWRGEKTNLTAVVGYRGRTQIDLKEFDSHFPTASLWLDRELGARTALRARYDFGYAWVGGQSFLLTNNGELSLFQGWERAGTSRVFFGAFGDEYFFTNPDVQDGPGQPGGFCADATMLCGPPGIDESRARDRDGWGMTTGIGQSASLPDAGAILTGNALDAGYRYVRYDPRGTEFRYDAHELWIDATTGLPGDLVFGLGGGYIHRPFPNPSTFPEPNGLTLGVQYPLPATGRSENAWLARAALSRSFFEHFTLSARWRYLDNQSPVSVFAYDHHVVGVYLSAALARTP